MPWRELHLNWGRSCRCFIWVWIRLWRHLFCKKPTHRWRMRIWECTASAAVGPATLLCRVLTVVWQQRLVTGRRWWMYWMVIIPRMIINALNGHYSSEWSLFPRMVIIPQNGLQNGLRPCPRFQSSGSTRARDRVTYSKLHFSVAGFPSMENWPFRFPV